MEAQKLANQKLVELLLATIADFVWKYNQNDIVAAVKGVCWKLLHSRTHKLSKHKRRQAKALIMILGREFAQQTKRKMKDGGGDDEEVRPNDDGDEQVCPNKSSSSSSSSSFSVGDEYMDFQARFEIALQMATTTVHYLLFIHLFLLFIDLLG